MLVKVRLKLNNIVLNSLQKIIIIYATGYGYLYYGYSKCNINLSQSRYVN